MRTGNSVYYDRSVFPLRNYGSASGFLKGHGTFDHTNDPVCDRNRRYQSTVDLCVLPTAQILIFSFYFLSGVMGRDNPDAGCLLLLCKKEICSREIRDCVILHIYSFLHFLCKRGNIIFGQSGIVHTYEKTGSLRIKQAERKMNSFDPKPDLGNANVGIIREFLCGRTFDEVPRFFFVQNSGRLGAPLSAAIQNDADTQKKG